MSDVPRPRPARVRVTSPPARPRAAARRSPPRSTRRPTLGEVYMRSLMRSQLRLALRRRRPCWRSRVGLLPLLFAARARRAHGRRARHPARLACCSAFGVYPCPARPGLRSTCAAPSATSADFRDLVGPRPSDRRERRVARPRRAARSSAGDPGDRRLRAARSRAPPATSTSPPAPSARA